MSERAFIDTNVFLYSTGPNPLARDAALRPLREVARQPQLFWSTAEVLQEIVHVCLRRGLHERAIETVATVIDLLGAHVEPLLARDVASALGKRSSASRLQARDLTHLAVMQRLGIAHIISADRGFDGVPGITRLDPRTFSDWRDTIFEH